VDLDALWIQVAGFLFIGSYLGCYFWMMSDEEVGRVP
jgi:hypothetical protein